MRSQPRAATEIREAAAWYEGQRTGLSVEFVHALDRTFSEIGKRPESCPMFRGRIRRALVRRFPYGVFFIESERAVTVLAVIHARRIHDFGHLDLHANDRCSCQAMY